MPCSDPDRPCYIRHPDDKIKIDKLTQDLCFLCANLLDAELLSKFASPRIIKWHLKHAKSDEERVTQKIKDMLADDDELITNPKKVAKKLIRKAEDVHPVSEWHKRWFHRLAREISEEMIKDINNKNAKETEKQKVLDGLTKKEKNLLGLDS